MKDRPKDAKPILQSETYAGRVLDQRAATGWTTSDATERAAAHEFNARERATLYPCTACGKFAFHVPTVCYWCRTVTRG